MKGFVRCWIYVEDLLKISCRRRREAGFSFPIISLTSIGAKLYCAGSAPAAVEPGIVNLLTCFVQNRESESSSKDDLIASVWTAGFRRS